MNSIEDIRPTPKNSRLRAFGVFGVLALVFCAGLYAGIHEALLHAQAPNGIPANTGITVTLGGGGAPTNVDMTQFWRAWTLLQQNFVQAHATGTTPSDQQKIYGAIS